MKNIDLWNGYKEILEKRDQEFIKSIIGEKLPEVFYTVDSRFDTDDYYRVGVNIIEKAIYWHGTSVIWLNGKKPTNIAVQALKNYVEGEIAYEIAQIMLCWKKGNTTSGAIHWPDFVAKKGIYDNFKEATEIVESKRTKYVEEKAQLEAGTHLKCCYCGTVCKTEDIHYARIWSPNWKATGGQSPPRPYCKGKGCAGYDQMGHEG